MYVRFVILAVDEDSHAEQGLFQAAADLLEGDQFAEPDRSLVEETLNWLAKQLPVPNRFSRSRRRSAQKKAISWFKSSAGDYIARMETLAVLVEQQGYHVKRITTRRPGYVAYEDEYQIVAEGFRDPGR